VDNFSASFQTALPLPKQEVLKEYSNPHKQPQEETNASKQNTGFLSAKRTVKDNHEQAVPIRPLALSNRHRKKTRPSYSKQRADQMGEKEPHLAD
jgi:hypothetical protein